jgi:hypothetical protein
MTKRYTADLLTLNKKARGVGLANRPSVHSVVLFAVNFTYF